MDNKQVIRLGHSPDPDDAFMFYGLACGAVDTEPFVFEHVLRDIQTLNDWAYLGKLEVTAVSVHAYAYLQDKYFLLSSGASMGAAQLVSYESDAALLFPVKSAASPPCCSTAPAHGPLLVAAQPIPLDQLTDKTIAVPGTLTSAFLVLRLILGEIDYIVMMFDEIPAAVRRGKVDAGLIIHEGQLNYQKAGLHCLIDLGRWWFEKTHLPLPLGCNVIRRDLGPDKIARISSILRSSINYGLAHRPQALQYAQRFARDLDPDLVDNFVNMYVNEWTLDYGPLGRKAVQTFLQQGHAAGLTPPMGELRFV